MKQNCFVSLLFQLYFRCNHCLTNIRKLRMQKNDSSLSMHHYTDDVTDEWLPQWRCDPVLTHCSPAVITSQLPHVAIICLILQSFRGIWYMSCQRSHRYSVCKRDVQRRTTEDSDEKILSTERKGLLRACDKTESAVISGTRWHQLGHTFPKKTTLLSYAKIFRFFRATA